MRKGWLPLIVLVVILAASTGCLNYTQTGFGYIGTEPQVVLAFNDTHAVPETKKAAVTQKVYLTFDDGPDYTNTPMVLDILDTYGVKATFFVVGTNIAKNPEILKDIVARGHALGNHTYSHRYSEVYASSASFLKSVKTNEDLIYQLVRQRPRVVRDPGGVARNNNTLKGLLNQNGYRLVHWNVDSYDSRKQSSEGEDIVENIRQQTMKKKTWPQMVILMHDGSGHIDTVRALPTIIEMLKSQGFEFDVLR